MTDGNAAGMTVGLAVSARRIGLEPGGFVPAAAREARQEPLRFAPDFVGLECAGRCELGRVFSHVAIDVALDQGAGRSPRR